MSSRKKAFAHFLLTFHLAVIGLHSTHAEVESYECDEDYCDYGENECMCARGEPPGGLPAERTPQFIVITADNAVTQATEYAMRRITEPHKNSNGCTIPATWFTEVNFTDASLVRELYLDGYEIATKTCCHSANPTVEEVIEARSWVSENAGIPQNAVNGFRSPYLMHDANTRSILYKYGFRYDSSITERYGTYNSITSQTVENRLWPYTMDYGIPQHCSSGSGGSGSCYEEEQYPGLWEVPMWVTQDKYGYAISAMDPWSDTESVYDIYKRELERNYRSNRAPVGIFLHPGWLLSDKTNIKNLNWFLRDALRYNDTYVVTMNQLLEYLTEPVDADTFRETFTKEVQCPEGGYVPNWPPDQAKDEDANDKEQEPSDDNAEDDMVDAGAEEDDEVEGDDGSDLAAAESSSTYGDGGYFEDVPPEEYVALAEDHYNNTMRHRRMMAVITGIALAVIGIGSYLAYLHIKSEEESTLQQQLFEEDDSVENEHAQMPQ